MLVHPVSVCSLVMEMNLVSVYNLSLVVDISKQPVSVYVDICLPLLSNRPV